MDEPLQEFEAELKALRPRPVSSRLLNRIGHELTTSVDVNSRVLEFGSMAERPFNTWRWLGFGAVGVAAAIAFTITVFRSSQPKGSVHLPAAEGVTEQANSTLTPRPVSSISGDAYQPVAASNVLYEMKDEGPASDKGDGLERRVRYRYVDTYTWKNPRNNALITWSVPRDEIRVQPAQFN